MHLDLNWTACLFILDGLISAKGQYRLGGYFMSPFIYTTILKNEFMRTYPEWHIVGSYYDITHAYDRAMAILDKLKVEEHLISLKIGQPDVTTWRDWLEFDAAKSSLKAKKKEALSNGGQENRMEAIVSIIIVSGDDLKYFSRSVYDKGIPSSIILVICRANNESLKQSENLDVRIFQESIENDLLDSSDEIADGESFEIRSKSSEDTYLGVESNEVKVPSQYTHNQVPMETGLEREAVVSTIISELKPDSGVVAEKSKGHESNIKGSFRISNKDNVFKRKGETFIDDVDQPEGNDKRAQHIKHLLFLRQIAKKVEGRGDDYDQNSRTDRKILNTDSKNSLRNELDSGQNIIGHLHDADRKYSSQLTEPKFIQFGKEQMIDQETQNLPEEAAAASDSRWSNSLRDDSPKSQAASHYIPIREEIGGDFIRSGPKSMPLLRTKDDKDTYFELNCKRFLDSLQVDEKKQKEIEENTKEQADCKRWHQERKYRLTASCFGIVMNWTESKERLVYRLLYSFPRNSSERISALNWGRENERKAALAYGRANNVSVEPAGLVVDLKRGFLAASPDGLIGNDTLCEIKCPYFLRHSVPLGLVKTDELYCCTYDFDKGKVRLKREHYYYYQLQGQMGISGRKKGVFILWSPRGMLTETIDFDPELWDRMVVILERFYKDYLVPEYIYNYHRYETQYDDTT